MKKLYLLFLLLMVSVSWTYASEQNNLIKIFTFKSGEMGYGSLNNRDNSLFLNIFNENEEKWIYRPIDGKKVFNATKVAISPDGKYYTYELGQMLYVYNEKDELIRKVPVGDLYYPLVWSYDSKCIYYCEQLEDYITFSFDIKTGTKKVVLKSKGVYFFPLTVKDNNVLFFLENTTPDDAGAICNIVKYDVSNKKFKRVKLPTIKDLWIFDSYSVSPDGKILIFENANEGIIYVVNTTNTKVLDKIKTPMNSHPEGFSWKSDGSYVIFTMTQREIYKYTIPKH